MTDKNGKQRECAIILDAATTLSLSLHSDSHGRFRKATGFTFTRLQPQPFPPRTEEEVKELKRRAASPNKLGGRCSLVTSNYVVFNPSAFALFVASLVVGMRGLCRWVPPGLGVGACIRWVVFFTKSCFTDGRKEVQ